MLRNCIPVLIIIVLVTACGPTEKEKLQAELVQLKQENDAYKAQEGEMTVSIESYKKLLNEINKNLKAIDNSTLQVKSKQSEIKSEKDVGQQVLIRIKSIHAMMENAKMKVQTLDKTLTELRKKYGDQSEEVLALNRELKEVANELIQREQEFEQMKSAYESDIEGLEGALEEQLKITEELKDLIDRAYYFAGTRKDLNEKNIIDKEGGFIGVGRVKVLNAKSPDRMFTKISKEQTEKITLAVKKMELITQHDPKSFAIVSSDSNTVLNIKDKKAFWKTSNYLVIQTSTMKEEAETAKMP